MAGKHPLAERVVPKEKDTKEDSVNNTRILLHYMPNSKAFYFVNVP
jgi:hypothetical protein